MDKVLNYLNLSFFYSFWYLYYKSAFSLPTEIALWITFFVTYIRNRSKPFLCLSVQTIRIHNSVLVKKSILCCRIRSWLKSLLIGTKDSPLPSTWTSTSAMAKGKEANISASPTFLPTVKLSTSYAYSLLLKLY